MHEHAPWLVHLHMHEQRGMQENTKEIRYMTNLIILEQPSYKQKKLATQQ